MTLFEDLKWRGLIQDVSSPEIEKILNGSPVNFYWGEFIRNAPTV